MNMFNKIKESISNKSIHDFMKFAEPKDVCIICKKEYPPSSFNRGCSNKICHECFDNLAECVSCGKRSVNLNKHGICKRCLHDTAYVNSYGHKPRPMFHRVYKDEVICTDIQGKYLHFGVELETDAHGYIKGNSLASFVRLISKGLSGRECLLYVKEDSTCYYEFVSHPFSWKYLNTFGKDIFQTLFKALRQDNYSGHNGEDCGMHVHVSKKAVKRTSLMKILSLMYNPDNYQFILDVSQRTDTRLNEWASPQLSRHFLYDIPNPYSYLAKLSFDNETSEIDSHIGRSVAVNLLPKNTIEFRLFRGTLNYNSFIKNLEFVKSVVDWSNIVSWNTAKYNSLTSYLKFLKENQNNYTELCFFLKRRGYGNFKNASDKMTRKHLTKLSQLRYDSDSREAI